jgi:hypothetical protein
VDFFSLDVEGGEEAVLQSLDFNQVKYCCLLEVEVDIEFSVEIEVQGCFKLKSVFFPPRL